MESKSRKDYMREYNNNYRENVLTPEKKKDYNKKYYEKNKEKISVSKKAYMKKWRAENREKLNKDARNFYKNKVKKLFDREVIDKNLRKKKTRKENSKNYYENHKLEILNKRKNKLKKEGNAYQKEYRKNNRKKINQLNIKYSARRKERDAEFKLLCNLRTRLWLAIRAYATLGKIMTSKGYGIDYEKIIEHLKPFPENLEEYHVDHIKPLCTFDLNDSKQIKKAFAPENHQWLLAEENLIKGGKY